MKIIPILAALVVLVQGRGQAQNYNNILRQQNLDSSTVWDMQNLAASGTSSSVMRLNESGARFELWTVEGSSGRSHLLDQQLVGTYLPYAKVTITTQDPFQEIPRTRIDKPFTVTAEVSNLLSGTGVPDAASRVIFERHVAAYPTDEPALDPAAVIGGTPYWTGSITQNGTVTLNFAASSVTATNPLKASGEEHFTVFSLPEATHARTRIATANVQVWPVTTGTISGIRNGDQVRFTAPILTIAVDDLYPQSDAYLQVYPGPPALGTEGTPLNQFFVPNTSLVSQSAIRQVSNYEEDLPEEGVYTMELIAKTPFGLERLDHVTFIVNRTLTVRAMQVGFEGEQ